MRSILFAILMLCTSAFADDADGSVGGYEPATVVPVSRVTWKQAVPQGPAVPAGPSS